MVQTLFGRSHRSAVPIVFAWTYRPGKRAVPTGASQGRRQGGGQRNGVNLVWVRLTHRLNRRATGPTRAKLVAPMMAQQVSTRVDARLGAAQPCSTPLNQESNTGPVS